MSAEDIAAVREALSPQPYHDEYLLAEAAPARLEAAEQERDSLRLRLTVSAQAVMDQRDRAEAAEAAERESEEKRYAMQKLRDEAEWNRKIQKTFGEEQWELREAAEARVVTLEQNQQRNVGIVDELSSRCEALTAALNLSLMHLEDSRAIAAVRTALATSEQARTPAEDAQATKGTGI